MGQRWKEVQSDEEIEDLKVKLLAIGKVPPERYAPIVLFTVVGLFLLAGLVLPGIRNYGSRLTVTSAPLGASVYIGDRRVGTTPVETFVSAGDHTLSVRFPGFEEYTDKLTVSGRLVGSLFFPRREHVEIRFRPSSIQYDCSLPPTDAFGALMQEHHEWALAGIPGGQFQHPPTGRTLGRIMWANLDIPRSRHENLWKDTTLSMVSAATAQQTPDLLSGALRSAIPGAVLHVGQLEKIVQLFIQSDSNYHALYEVVSDLIGDSAVEEYLDSTSWYENRRESQSTTLLANSIEMDERGLSGNRQVTFEGIFFAVVPEGSFISGYPLRNDEETGVVREMENPFYIGTTEITERQFARFLEENATWRPSGTESLIIQGLADERYLIHWPDDGEWTTFPAAEEEADRPVRNVSWFAARAYVQWLNRRFQAAGVTFDGIPRNELEIRLPDTMSWEYAAFLNGLGPGDRVFNAPFVAGAATGRAGAIGAFHLSGNVWEWTSDWYTRHLRIMPSEYGAQRAVIGGSFANDPVPPGTVGGQPPHWCTPFLGFRPAIYRVSDL